MVTNLVALTPAQLAQMTPEQIAAYVAKLAANQKPEPKRKPISFRASEKGAVSLYGTQARFPVTQYPEQWERIAIEGLGLTAETFKASPLGQFIEQNRSRLNFKSEEVAEVATA